MDFIAETVEGLTTVLHYSFLGTIIVAMPSMRSLHCFLNAQESCVDYNKEKKIYKYKPQSPPQKESVTLALHYNQ